MISLYSSKVVDNSANEPETKRSRTTGTRSLRSSPLYQRLENALDAECLSILVKEAISKPIQMDAGHAMAESKCFCFNGYIKWDKNLQPEFEPNSKIIDLLPRKKAHSWGSLSKSVQKAVLKMFHIAGQQSHKIGADLAEKTSWVAFELIKVPLHKGKKVSELEWHRDGGYYDNFNNPCSCYADYSTIFMLADPDNWEGGDLELQRNGEKRKDGPSQDGTSTLIQYRHNEAVTFYNRDSRHRVTPILPKSDTNRIIFTCCIYGAKETKDYRASQEK